MYRGLSILFTFIGLVAALQLPWQTGSSHTALDAVAKEQQSARSAVAPTRFMGLIASTSDLSELAVNELRQDKQLSSYMGSECSVRALHAFKIHCEGEDMLEDDRRIAAIVWTICELNTSASPDIPRECDSFDVNRSHDQAEALPAADAKECVRALRSVNAHQIYSGYYRNAVTLCHSFAHKRDKDHLERTVLDVLHGLPIAVQTSVQAAVSKLHETFTDWVRDAERAHKEDRDTIVQSATETVSDAIKRQIDDSQAERAALMQSLQDPLQMVVRELSLAPVHLRQVGEEMAENVSTLATSMGSLADAFLLKFSQDIGVLVAGIPSQVLIKYDAALTGIFDNSATSFENSVSEIMQRISYQSLVISDSQAIVIRGLDDARIASNMLTQDLSGMVNSAKDIGMQLGMLGEGIVAITRYQEERLERTVVIFEDIERRQITLNESLGEMSIMTSNTRQDIQAISVVITWLKGIFSLDLVSLLSFWRNASWSTWLASAFFLFYVSGRIHDITLRYCTPTLSVVLTGCAFWWRILQFGRAYAIRLIFLKPRLNKSQLSSSFLPTLVTPDPLIKNEPQDFLFQFDDACDDEQLERDLTPSPRELLHDDVQEDYMHQIRRQSSLYSSTDSDSSSSISSYSGSHSRLLDDLPRHVDTLKHTGHAHRRIRTDLATLSVMRVPHRSADHKSRIFLPSRDF